MGNCISGIEDFRDDYLWRCEQLKIDPKSYDQMHEHNNELREKFAERIDLFPIMTGDSSKFDFGNDPYWFDV